MNVPGDVGSEVDELAVAGRGGSFGDQIPIGGEVVELAAIGRDAVEIDGGAVILSGLKDLIQTLLATEDYGVAIAGPGGRIVFEPIVGETVCCAFEIDGPEIGALVGVF